MYCCTGRQWYFLGGSVTVSIVLGIFYIIHWGQLYHWTYMARWKVYIDTCQHMWHGYPMSSTTFHVLRGHAPSCVELDKATGVVGGEVTGVGCKTGHFTIIACNWAGDSNPCVDFGTLLTEMRSIWLSQQTLVEFHWLSVFCWLKQASNSWSLLLSSTWNSVATKAFKSHSRAQSKAMYLSCQHVLW